MAPEHSAADSSLRTESRTTRGDDTAVEARRDLNHGLQDRLESEASARTKKWSVWKSLTLIAFASIALWALIILTYQAL